MASFKYHPDAVITLTIVVALAVCADAEPVPFAGGTGEPNDPYQIATAEQLIAIGSDPNLFDKHFVLTADIDLDPNLPSRKTLREAVMEWPATEPKGFGTALFHGSFDGAGHVIRNCVLLSTSDTHRAGFFAVIAPRGVVCNLHIENMMITDPGYTTSRLSSSGLLAAINQGTVVGCSATGTLSIHGGGGLIGQNTGLVVGCRARCHIIGGFIGGLIGTNGSTGRVMLCEFDGVLYGDPRAGGLASLNDGTIQYCKAGGSVSALAGAGGLASSNAALIRECCVTATVESGGGVTYENRGTMANCYVTGVVLGDHIDGLAVTNSGQILSSYSTTASWTEYWSHVRYVYYLDPNKVQDRAESLYSGYGMALSQAQMTQKSSFVGFDFCDDAGDGTSGHWFMPPDGYPVLTWQAEITGLAGVPDVWGLSPEQAGLVLEQAGFEPNGLRYDYARPRRISTGWSVQEVETKGRAIATYPVGYRPPGALVEIVVSLGRYDFSTNAGDGSEAKPYQIETAGQLDALCDLYALWDKHFELTADIDLSGYFYPGSLIGSFHGELNGNGHTIRNLQGGGGLFDSIASEASVHDLVLENALVYDLTMHQKSAQIPPYSMVGILAGRNAGQVSRCLVAGRILGGVFYTGGLVGSNTGQLTDCSFSGRIRATDTGMCVGGLAGANTGSIIGCCAHDVDVSGGNYVGGVAGQNDYVTAVIEACYATGTVQGVDFVGGLVGQNGVPSDFRRSMAPSVVRDCYAACAVTGRKYVGGCIGSAAVPGAVQESCFFLAPIDGGGADNGLGTPLTASQMQQQASFGGWDFENLWMICEGRDYPRLRWEGVECGLER